MAFRNGRFSSALKEFVTTCNFVSISLNHLFVFRVCNIKTCSSYCGRACVKIARADKIARGDKIARRQLCTGGQNCAKTYLNGCQICTKTLLHEQTILHGDTFARRVTFARVTILHGIFFLTLIFNPNPNIYIFSKFCLCF